MFLELLAAAAVASDCPHRPGTPEPVSASPDWLLKPSYQDIYWAYPSRAVSELIPGRALIKCELSEQGVTEACQIVSEEPAGYGFGEAAISLTSKMLFKPRVKCGVVVRGTVQIPLAFKLPEKTSTYSTAPLDPGDRKLSLAARLVAAMKLSEITKEASDMGALSLIRTIDEERAVDESSQLTAAERQLLHDTAREVWVEYEAKVINAVVRYYADQLSEEELSASITYFEGPAGSKLVGAMRSAEDPINATLEELTPELILDFRRRLCTRSAELCDEEGEL